MPTGRRSGANSPRLNLNTARIGHVQAAIVDEAELGQDDGVLGDARTWLVRRRPQGESRNGG
jgi:hypothetical protein